MNGRECKWRQQSAVVLVKMMLLIPVFAGWSGFLYPDLTFQKGVAEACSATSGEQIELSGQELYEELLKAEPEQIRVKSRLFEFLYKQFH